MFTALLAGVAALALALTVTGCGGGRPSSSKVLARLESASPYNRSFRSGTSIADARAAVLNEFPRDAHVASFTVRNICALMEVRSVSLESGLSAGGFPDRIWVEFNNSAENTTHTVYDPSSVDTALISVENKGWAPEC
jgi:hypothetical protein